MEARDRDRFLPPLSAHKKFSTATNLVTFVHFALPPTSSRAGARRHARAQACEQTSTGRDGGGGRGARKYGHHRAYARARTTTCEGATTRAQRAHTCDRTHARTHARPLEQAPGQTYRRRKNVPSSTYPYARTRAHVMVARTRANSFAPKGHVTKAPQPKTLVAQIHPAFLTLYFISTFIHLFIFPK